MERYLRVNLLRPGPRLMKKEFTGPNLKNGKVFTSKFVVTGPSSFEKNNLPGRTLKKWKGIYE